MFIDKILYHKANIKLFLENNGIKLMVDMLTLAHLHTTRAYVPTQVRRPVVLCDLMWFNHVTSHSVLMVVLTVLIANSDKQSNLCVFSSQTNVIEAAPDANRDTEREWYFSNKEREREGPYGFREVSLVLPCSRKEALVGGVVGKYCVNEF